jgi:tetratricopeptide (TPR) repeat protein
VPESKYLMRAALRALSLAFVGQLVAWSAADPAIDRAFDHFYNLEYDEALTEFRAAVIAHPDVIEYHNNVAQALLYREMFRNGALESQMISGNNAFLRRPKLNATPEVESEFYSQVTTALRLAQARIAKNPNDAAAFYAEGVAYGLRSNYNFLVKKAWTDSLKDAGEARKAHNRVTELQPDNYDARLVQGVHDYLMGSLSLFYRTIGSVFGVKGDRAGGIRTLELVAEKGKSDRDDAEVLLCALLRREGRPREALPYLTDLLSKYPRNYLLRFEKAQMYSAIGDKTNALKELQIVVDLHGKHTPGFAQIPEEKIFYERANVEFWYNDLTHSLEDFQRVTAHAKDLDLNTGVLSYMRQGQIYDMTHRHGQAIEQYRKAIAFAPEAEAAKESKHYINSPYQRSRS